MSLKVNHLLIFSFIIFCLSSCSKTQPQQNKFQYQSIWDAPNKKQILAIKSPQPLALKNIPTSPNLLNPYNSKIKIVLVLPLKGKDFNSAKKVLDGFLISFWYSPKIFKQRTIIQIYNEDDYKKNLSTHSIEPSSFIVKPVLSENDTKINSYELGEKAFSQVYQEIKQSI